MATKGGRSPVSLSFSDLTIAERTLLFVSMTFSISKGNNFLQNTWISPCSLLLTTNVPSFVTGGTNIETKLAITPKSFLFNLLMDRTCNWMLPLCPTGSRNPSSSVSYSLPHFLKSGKGHWAVKILQHATPTVTWYSILKINSKDPWHSQLLPSVRQWSCNCLF